MEDPRRPTAALARGALRNGRVSARKPCLSREDSSNTPRPTDAGRGLVPTGRSAGGELSRGNRGDLVLEIQQTGRIRAGGHITMEDR